MPELGSVTAVHHLQTSLEEELGLASPEVRTRTNKYKLQGNGYRLGGEVSSFRAACGGISFREGLIRKHTQAATDDQLSGPQAIKFLCQDVPRP